MKPRTCPADHINHDNDGTTDLVLLARAARGKFSAVLAARDIALESLEWIVR